MNQSETHAVIHRKGLHGIIVQLRSWAPEAACHYEWIRQAEAMGVPWDAHLNGNRVQDDLGGPWVLRQEGPHHDLER